MKEPIAVIGMSCRFPKANTVEAFWQVLSHGVDAIGEVPTSRFDVDTLHDPIPRAPGKIASREGGFLDNINMFDAMFFGIPPREANALDPQQRLLLETAWEALEDAGQTPARLSGSKTGVFIGMWTNEYEDRMYGATSDVNLYVTTGGGRYAASGRLSYFFNLNGPSLTIDTACSSSLVAMHLAVQSLWNDESTMALVGGVNLILIPQITIGYSRSGMLSPDGRCKFGDASANGYVRSEGAGMVVLKPLSLALADGDPIHALIRGSAVNNDGRSSELLVAPSPDTQAVMLREAYHTAGVNPVDVQYVEAHGTGTPVGDPVELTALGRVLGEGRPSNQPCIVGSVKTNIGHTEAASGIAGFIKAVLSLKHRVIPPSLHLHNPNPNIPWKDLSLVIPQSLIPWPDTDGPAYAGVNSFGVTGTNAHIVLEAAPAREAHPPLTADVTRAFVLPLSARSKEALVTLAQAYLNVKDNLSLHDLAFTASTRRVHHDYRMAVVARSWEDLSERLAAFANGESRRGVVAAPEERPLSRKIAFVFSGQGGQWPGMGRKLADDEPVFREALGRCEAAIRPYVDWSLWTELNAAEDESRLHEIDVVQPLIFAVQVALAELWRSWGIEPDGVIGHSMGEVAAAYMAGILSLDDAAHVICRRSQLMKQVSGRGAMAVVELSQAEAKQALASFEDRLGIAVSNGPTSTVLSGDPAALQEVVSQLEGQGVFCRFVKVDVAAHSPQIDELQPLLVADLHSLQAHPERTPIFSTVAGERLSGDHFGAHYWGLNLRQMVRFAEAVEHALEDDYNIFIELSPHPVLLSAIEGWTSRERTLITLPAMRRNEDEQATLLESLAALYVAGHEVAWERLYPDGGNVVSLPAYPWQKERFWFTESSPFDPQWSLGRSSSKRGHPLLGHHLRSHNGTHYWETDINLATLPYLADHRVAGRAVLPAAAYAEMALAAAQEALGVGTNGLRNLTLREALFLAEDESKTVQVALTPQGAGSASFQIYGRQGESWVQHASGTIVTTMKQEQPAIESPQTIQTRLGESNDGGAHYRVMEQRALGYGSTFQSIAALRVRDGEGLAALRLHDDVRAASAAYEAHPALLDACFQLLLATLEDDNKSTYLPVSIGELILYEQPKTDAALYAHAMRGESDPDMLVGDVHLLDETGRVLLAVTGLRMKRLARQGDHLDNWLYQVRWTPVTDLSADIPATPGRWMVFADSQGIGEGLAANLQGIGEQVVMAYAGEEYQAGSGEYVVNPARRADFDQFLQDINREHHLDWRGVVFLWALDAAADDLPESAYVGTTGALHLVQMLSQAGLSPQVWLVTRGAQAVTDGVQNAAQASVWGLGAVLSNEHPEVKPVRVDLDSDGIHIETLVAELLSPDSEDQIAYRGGQRYAARLVLFTSEQPETPGEVRVVNPATQPFRAEVTTAGVLDNLRLRAMTRQQPGVGEVEIEVLATGLNFMNVMSALGVYPGYPNGVGPLGIECAGRIASVGEGVHEWQVGDEVVAVAFDSLATHAITDSRLVVRKPAGMSFDEAATIPIVFLTAYYALHHLAHMQAGERVLIHAGAGGVGQAAIQLAQHAGAEAWVTVGTPEKREFMHSLGVDKVMDSRSLAFADDILAATNGDGVDIVLNSLAGEAITKGLEVLRPYGRFVEIGKRDIYQNSSVGLLPFSKNLSYFAVDLDKMARERPAFVGQMLREIVSRVEAGELRPLPMTVFPAAQIADAFRHMAQGKHIGKIVIAPQTAAAPVFIPANTGVRDDASYLITGGLGGLGLTVARWLREQGARQIVLTGRRSPDEAAQAAIDNLRAAGVDVQVLLADVADPQAVEGLIHDIQERLMPLRGVFHAAGALDDGMLAQLDATRFYTIMSPKVDGAWNLHTATQGLELDWFVLFSSVTALLGTPGQANYTAGNAFLDGLAHYRRTKGLQALSINWGPWSEVGLAAAQANRGERLTQRGVGSLSPSDGIAILERLLSQDVTQAAAMPFDAAQWVQSYPAAAQSSLLAELLAIQLPTAESVHTSQLNNVRALLMAAEAGQAQYMLLENHIREQVSHVLGMSAARVDVAKPLRNMGLDSLMTLELRNRLDSSLGLKLPATLVFNYPTVVALTRHLAEKLDVAVADTANGGDSQMDDLEGLTQDEVQAMLAEELSSLDDLLKGN